MEKMECSKAFISLAIGFNVFYSIGSNIRYNNILLISVERRFQTPHDINYLVCCENNYKASVNKTLKAYEPYD